MFKKSSVAAMDIEDLSYSRPSFVAETTFVFPTDCFSCLYKKKSIKIDLCLRRRIDRGCGLSSSVHICIKTLICLSAFVFKPLDPFGSEKKKKSQIYK